MAGRGDFDEEILRFVEKCIDMGYGTRISINRVVTVLITFFNKRSLMQPAFARGWMPRFFSALECLDYGKYDTVLQELVLNTENDTVKRLIEGYKRGEQTGLNP